MNAVAVCQHERKALLRSSTTNWPRPAIVCAACMQTLVTIEEARRFIDAADDQHLLSALDGVLVGGNHLANILIGKLGGAFASKYPPEMEPEDALRMLCATDEYDIWCCWRSIMLARSALSIYGHAAPRSGSDTDRSARIE